MKRLLLIALGAMITVGASAQLAKRPTIMVVPSTIWCNENGYVEETNVNGKTKISPDWEAAIINDFDLNSVIINLGNEMGEIGFPLQDLGTVIQGISQSDALRSDDVMMTREDRILNSARADILIEVTWEIITNQNDQQSIRYNLKAVDAYSRTQIAGCDLISDPKPFLNPAKGIKDALTNTFPKFCDRLDNYFIDLEQKGREVRYTFEIMSNSMWDFNTEVGDEGYVLSEIIENWFIANAQSDAFQVPVASDYQMSFEHLRIPLFDTTRGTSLDARRFVNALARELRSTYGVTPVKVITVGLGECIIRIGE